VLSQFTPEPGSVHRCLSDFIDVEDVYPAGRLDADSEGLLLLTSDGPLQHLLTDPSRGHPRTYWVQVEGMPTQENVARLSAGGILIQDYRTRPAVVSVMQEAPALPAREPPIRVRKQIPTSWLELTLTEGRNRQVRRMTAAVGLPTLRLVRVAIGALRVEGLAPGAWRDLSEAELSGLRASLAESKSPPTRKPGSSASR
jgi:23S rRNA pseudouridine2457 synthase